MPGRKRSYAELDAKEPSSKPGPGLLSRLRNDWRLANLMQWLYLFGKEFKVDENFDMDILEEECLKSGPSDKLVEIGLCLLKHVSSHRGLTPELFDEYTRRQYLVRRPHENPFGEEEEPNKFSQFDIFAKLQVLHQLTLWIMSNPERFREKMATTKDSEQAQWRIEELGWDSEDRAYFVLDDNRLYRRTYRPLAPAPAAQSKSKSKSKSQSQSQSQSQSKSKTAFRPRPQGARTSKRHKANATQEPDEAETEADEEANEENMDHDSVGNDWDHVDNGLGGDKWECICVTLEDYQNFVQSLHRSRDPNERILQKRLIQDILPIIEQAEEDRQRKIAKHEKELLTLEKLALAKRSSRIASRVEKAKEKVVAREAEEKRQRDLLAAQKDVQRQKEMEEARMSRMMTREQRLKDREYRRILHETELRRMEEEQAKIERGEVEAKRSERSLKAKMKEAQEALEELNEEEEWVFDCSSCGVYGQNIDDGKHSIACERCNVWQHSACLNLTQDEAESDDYQFVCKDCIRREEEEERRREDEQRRREEEQRLREEEERRRQEDAKRPKLPPLKFKFSNAGSPPRPMQESVALAVPPVPETALKFIAVDPSQPRKVGGIVRKPEQQSSASGNPFVVRDVQHVRADGVKQEMNGSEERAPALSFAAAAALTAHDAGLAKGVTQKSSEIPRFPPPQSTTPAVVIPTKAAVAGVSTETNPVLRTPGTSFSNGVVGTDSIAAQPSYQHPLIPQKQQPLGTPSPAPKMSPLQSMASSSPALSPPARLLGSDASKLAGISPVKHSPPPPSSGGHNVWNSSFRSSLSSSSIEGTPVVPPSAKLEPVLAENGANAVAGGNLNTSSFSSAIFSSSPSIVLGTNTSDAVHAEGARPEPHSPLPGTALSRGGDLHNEQIHPLSHQQPQQHHMEKLQKQQQQQPSQQTLPPSAT